MFRSAAAAVAVSSLAAAQTASAFCGFYVAQADTKLFNESSKVVLAHDGDRTAITMASDYQGDAKEFALVVPVPTFIERDSISLVESATLDHIDAYSAPRLVEYFDSDPCHVPAPMALAMAPRIARHMAVGMPVPAPPPVTIEASYDVGEYDILILKAEESDGLVQWLNANGYKIPPGAEGVLGSYIRQHMHFFVAKVNLDRMKLIGAGYLRPLQVRYQSPKFMLPLRLGTVNAKGPQDLIVFALTPHGRVEAVNYPNVKMTSDLDVPLYVKAEFGAFYKAAFDKAAEARDRRAVFVEYAWDLGFCDPCSAKPLEAEELKRLGATWADQPLKGPGYITRLHVRYDAKSFPEDIAFEETADDSNFQARYILRHPWTGSASCEAAQAYRAGLSAQYTMQAANLASLTGWDAKDIKARMAVTGEAPPQNK